MEEEKTSKLKKTLKFILAFAGITTAVAYSLFFIYIFYTAYFGGEGYVTIYINRFNEADFEAVMGVFLIAVILTGYLVLLRELW